jgi:hypothetical protein
MIRTEDLVLVRLEVKDPSIDKNPDRDKESLSSLHSCRGASGDILISISIRHFRFYFTSRVRVTIELGEAEPGKVTMLTYNVNQVLNIMQLNNMLE